MPRTAEDVWSQVQRGAVDACWSFLGPISTNGYGQFYFAGRKHMAHRVTYALAHGEIPSGLVVDHLCRNRRCCNPAHLEAVTSLENSQRSPVWKGNLDRCPKGHPYAGDNLIVRRADQARLCRACQLDHSRARKRRLRAERAAIGLTSRGTPRKRPQAAHDSGPGCPGTVAASAS